MLIKIYKLLKLYFIELNEVSSFIISFKATTLLLKKQFVYLLVNRPALRPKYFLILRTSFSLNKKNISILCKTFVLIFS